VGFTFRLLISHSIGLIPQTETTHRMPTGGITLPISLLSTYQCKIRCPWCVTWFPPSVSFSNISERSSPQPMPTMPFLAINSSSSPRYVALGDHFATSSHQKTLLVVAYLQDMVLHHMASVDRVAVVSPATATSSFSLDTKGLRPWFFLLFL
jgi:hypothetical protein